MNPAPAKQASSATMLFDFFSTLRGPALGASLAWFLGVRRPYSRVSIHHGSFLRRGASGQHRQYERSAAAQGAQEQDQGHG
jgi:hypothetical protein